MWTYRSPDELYHWGIKKGAEKKNHKYIRREWKNGRWVYYYDDGKDKSLLRRLTGVTDHTYMSDYAVFTGNHTVTDVDTGARYNKDSKGNVKFDYAYGTPSDAKTTSKKTLFGHTKTIMTYSQNGEKYATTVIQNKKTNKLMSMNTRDITVDTGIERLIEKGKNSVSKYIHK